MIDLHFRVLSIKLTPSFGSREPSRFGDILLDPGFEFLSKELAEPTPIFPQRKAVRAKVVA
jgi:hypothetical protein